jgi:cytochrome c oxidase assembly protein subunit 15
MAFTAMLFGQILLGALVAGSDAGFSRNDWPRMNGEWLPGDYLSLSPAWRNFFENVATVQFNHRLGGYAVALAGLALAMFAWRTAARPVVRRLAVGLALATGAQTVLGVVTLIHAVPIALGLLHQAAAAMLLLLALTLWRASRRA